MNPEADGEVRRFSDKQANFRGYASVDLKFLRFDCEGDLQVHLDEKNVCRLVQIFELEGCLRSEIEHHVPVVISDADLQAGLDRAHVAREELFSSVPPLLDFPVGTRLRCLHGRHRLEAAWRHLMPGDKRWTVDLYLDSLEPSTQRYIGDDYSNSRNFCDGDIFRQIRACQMRNDLTGEGRWLARLSDCKRKYLKQFQQRKEMRGLAHAFDRLLPFTGMWPALQIGSFHRILNLKCPEELERYIDHIIRCWSTIVRNESDWSLVDFQTVKALELIHPRGSRADVEWMVGDMQNFRVFPHIRNERRRSNILTNLKSIDHTIPSLFTFFEDTKWLEPCAVVMRGLLDNPIRESLRRSFYRCFSGRDRETGVCLIQTSDSHSYEAKMTEANVVEMGYRQLWLFAWRHFPVLSSLEPRKDPGKPKPEIKGANERYWHQFAELAAALGFETASMKRILDRDSDKQMITEFLHHYRPATFYHIPEVDVQRYVNRLVSLLRPIKPRKQAVQMLSVPASEVPKPARCGRPHQTSHDESKWLFFHGHLQQSSSTTVSHFIVNRDIFNAFFGSMSTPEDLGAVSDGLGNPPPALTTAGHESSPGTGSVPSIEQATEVVHHIQPPVDGQLQLVTTAAGPTTEMESNDNDVNMAEEQLQLAAATGELNTREIASSSGDKDVNMAEEQLQLAAATGELNTRETASSSGDNDVNMAEEQLQLATTTRVTTDSLAVPVPQEPETDALKTDVRHGVPTADEQLAVKVIKPPVLQQTIDLETEPPTQQEGIQNEGPEVLIHDRAKKLYQAWADKCLNDYLFFVVFPNLKFFLCDPEKIPDLNSQVLRLITNCSYLATYIPNTKRLRCITIEKLQSYAKTSPKGVRDKTHRDGIIYVFPKKSEYRCMTFIHVRGSSTMARLKSACRIWAEVREQKKKEFGNPRKETGSHETPQEAEHSSDIATRALPKPNAAPSQALVTRNFHTICEDVDNDSEV